ncbi:hypothetical protein CO058_01100 [candidate division WWE3 bacterium CG_4_9_14_0_2_um_filter_35_11]|uniref:Dipeptidylpeptidase IV N-terminal domain-containing protein n=1 Tax=candidate division WWE3 bacterium CG_4_9_14_0_2_um_filter_35_11 TaxID=1975077 RepID=A0A2M8EMA4_UNCKA|nr:MAG: hypothetical protein COV25_03235 [candidate division WWE3 bacterium CG10_big_fil_rev_8_21_14_0_10_35_32]PJC23876.1 MAG: hypothetical protein CO058_01100 [candidate division WWE3 bacterium CG_4_9_14_0_2_um_filter_35_11]
MALILVVGFCYFLPVSANTKNLINVSDLSKDDSQKQVYFDDKPLRSLELSPSGKQVAFFCVPNNQSSEELSLILLEKESNASQTIYHTQFASWDVTSNLHWLGERPHIFLRHCGTACHGITLLDIKTKERKIATLSYSSFPDQPAMTYFEDWFGKKHQLDGFVREVYSEMIDHRPYLIFDMMDGKGSEIGQRKFLFTETAILLEGH